MIPTNYNQKHGCTLISSSCILWQGDNIRCIETCNGDSLQQVVEKIGELLCEINDLLTPSTYDLSCFNFGECPPSNFHDLLQFILDSICTLNNLIGNNAGVPNGEDVEIKPKLSSYQIPLPPALQFNDFYGNRITSLPLYTTSHNDYLSLIGNRLSETILELENKQDQINQINYRIDVLENTFVNNQIIIPALPLSCGFEDIVFQQSISVWQGVLVRLQNYIGQLGVIYDGICQDPNGSNLMMFQSSSFNQLYSEMQSSSVGVCNGNALSIGQTKNIITAFSNIWEYIKDIRNYINNKLCNVCNKCQHVSHISLRYVFTNKENILFVMNLPEGYSLSGNYIYYNLYNGSEGDNVNYKSQEQSLTFTVSIQAPYRDYYIMHVSGCVRDANFNDCRYEFAIPVFNPYYGCFKYKNVSVSISNITVTTIP